MEAESRDADRQRLSLLDALVVAIERRREVFELIEQSATADDARQALTELLGVEDTGAIAILDLQARRFTQQARRRIIDERDVLRRRLG